MSLEDFKAKLKLTQKSYNTYSNIKVKVITPSIKEINQKTDIRIIVEEIKLGRKVHSLRFKVEGVSKTKSYSKKIENGCNNFKPKGVYYNENKLKGFNNFEGRKYTKEDYQRIEDLLL